MGSLAQVAVCTHSKGGEANDGAHARAGREAHRVEHDGQAGMELGDDLQGRERVSEPAKWARAAGIQRRDAIQEQHKKPKLQVSFLVR
jgi:hypothetical protein